MTNILINSFYRIIYLHTSSIYVENERVVIKHTHKNVIRNISKNETLT